MFAAYYSEGARSVAGWALTEENRIKASKILKAAQNMERRNRICHGDVTGTKARYSGGWRLVPMFPVP